MANARPTDEQIISAVRDGARTPYIADRLGMLHRRQYILNRLKRLEHLALVVRDPRYSSDNSIYWSRPSPEGEANG